MVGASGFTYGFETAMTLIICLSRLLRGSGSISFAVTIAVFVIVPALEDPSVIVIVATSLFASVPRSHSSVQSIFAQVPWLDEADTKLTLRGRVSCSITPVALQGPRFVTVRTQT